VLLGRTDGATVGPGRKFLRLQFYPANYSSHDAADALISVFVPAAKDMLLCNFSAYQTATSLNFAYIIREFSVNITGPILNLVFNPEKSRLGAYAFVNGIEVVSSHHRFDISTPLFITGDVNNQPFPRWILAPLCRPCTSSTSEARRSPFPMTPAGSARGTTTCPGDPRFLS
jgi:hypothetical protein